MLGSEEELHHRWRKQMATARCAGDHGDKRKQTCSESSARLHRSRVDTQLLETLRPAPNGIHDLNICDDDVRFPSWLSIGLRSRTAHPDRYTSSSSGGVVGRSRLEVLIAVAVTLLLIAIWCTGMFLVFRWLWPSD